MHAIRSGSGPSRLARPPRPADDGSMVITVMLSVTAVVAAVAIAMAAMVGDLGDAGRARTAADAAALASVTEGRSAAARLASANGAVLVSWSRRGEVVEVVVRVGEATARARATDSP